MMVTFSIIQKSQREGAQRIDAEYYQPEYLENDKIIKNYKNGFRFLVDLLKRKNAITGGATPLGADYPDSGIPFLRVQNVMPNYLDLSDVVYISEDIHTGSLRRSMLKVGDVLLTITGVSYGKSATIPRGFKEGNINQHSVKIEVDDTIVLPEFLSTFFNSRFGKYQNDRKITGLSRPGLVYTELKNILIPLISLENQRQIRETIVEANETLKKSEAFYSQAEDLLLQELGLKDLKSRDDLAFIVNLSDIKSASRMDADYFQPKYKKLVNKIQQFKGEKLGNLAKRLKVKTKPKSEKIYKYIEISDVNVGNGEVNFNEIIGDQLPPNARIAIQGGELIISKVRPTRKAIAIIPVDFNQDFICSFAFSIFQVEEVLKEYLFVLLRSLIGRSQLEQPSTGTEYPTITNEDVEDIKVPILPKSSQQEISDLVRKSQVARKKAKELLDEAKRKVEELIEKA